MLTKEVAITSIINVDDAAILGMLNMMAQSKPLSFDIEINREARKEVLNQALSRNLARFPEPATT